MSTLEQYAQQAGVLPTQEQKDKDARAWKKTEINGKVVEVKMLKGRTQGVQVALKLKGMALPLIGRGFDGLRDEDSLEPPKTFTEMALILADQLENNDVDNLIFENLLANVKVDGLLVTDWDDYLQCNYGELVPMLSFAVKENFQSFFTGNGWMTKIQTVAQKILGLKEDSQEESTKTE